MGWLEPILELKNSFNIIRFAHIYREEYGEADTYRKKRFRCQKERSISTNGSMVTRVPLIL